LRPLAGGTLEVSGAGPSDRREPRGRAPWLEGGLLALVVFAILAVGGETVRASYHGFLHSTVGEAVMRDGLHPENPYHAGTSLRYYLLYPFLGVLLGRTGIGPLWGFALLSVLAAFLFGPALDALGRAFRLSWSARRAAFLAAVLGLNALGWTGFFFAHGAAAGDPPLYLLRPMTFSSFFFSWDPRIQAFLPKYLNVSSYALAIPFGLWALAEAARVLQADDSPERARPVRALLPAAASLALNPLVGGFAGLCMFFWVAGSLRRLDRGDLLRWLGTGLGAIALSLPLLLPAFQPAPGGELLTGGLSFRGSPLGNVLGPLLLLLPFGLAGLRCFPRPLLVRFLLAVVLAWFLLVRGGLPWQNEYKLARLGAILWALPAGACLAELVRRRRGRLLAAGLILLSLPTTGAAVWAYLEWGLHAPPLPVMTGPDGRLEPDPSAVPGALPRGILLAERHADPRGVLLLDLRQPGSRSGEGSLIQGNVLASAFDHPLVVDDVQTLNDGIPDLGRRRDQAYAIWTGTAVPRTPEDPGQPMDRLAALAGLRAALPARPFLVINFDRFLVVTRILEQQAGARPLARDGGYTLWWLPPLRAGSGS